MVNYDLCHSKEARKFLNRNPTVETNIKSFLEDIIRKNRVTIIDRISTEKIGNKSCAKFVPHEGRCEILILPSTLYHFYGDDIEMFGRSILAHEIYHAKEYELLCAAVGWKNVPRVDVYTGGSEGVFSSNGYLFWSEFFAEYSTCLEFKTDLNRYMSKLSNMSIVGAMNKLKAAISTGSYSEQLIRTHTTVCIYVYHIIHYIAWCEANSVELDWHLLNMSNNIRDVMDSMRHIVLSILSDFPNKDSTLQKANLLGKEVERLFGIFDIKFS